MNGRNQNFCSLISMMSKECLEHPCWWTTRWQSSTLFGHMLLRHWTLARRQGGHVMDPWDQDKQRYCMRHMLAVPSREVSRLRGRSRPQLIWSACQPAVRSSNAEGIRSWHVSTLVLASSTLAKILKGLQAMATVCRTQYRIQDYRGSQPTCFSNVSICVTLSDTYDPWHLRRP